MSAHIDARTPRPWLLCSLPLLACDPAPAPGQRVVPDPREAWTLADDPKLLADDFNFTHAELPASGLAAKTPWAGSYWPTHKDSINARWAGPDSQSAAHKYGLAFARDGVEDAVSAAFGVDSLVGTPCTTDLDCASEPGSVCARRTGETAGTCSETWFGLCHAWAPAAILEDEPLGPVVHNGVEFKVNDLKALISLTYADGLDVKFMSLRCDDSLKTGDIAGNGACKDTNAGSFHVVVANLLGLRGQAFIEDRTIDYQVWNQPVRGYKVTHDAALTGQQANQLLGAADELSRVEHAGTVAASTFVAVHQLPVTPGHTLRVRMSGTGDADLFVRWNAVPTELDFACRPYIEGSHELCELVVPPAAETAHIAVDGYAASSDYKIVTSVLGVAPDDYAFNPDAAALRQLQMELYWVAEADMAIDGNLAATINQYTRKDIYDYVLELDADGAIVGGEWVSSSKLSHPDFLWLPVKKHPGTVASVIKYAEVQKLLELANGAP